MAHITTYKSKYKTYSKLFIVGGNVSASVASIEINSLGPIGSIDGSSWSAVLELSPGVNNFNVKPIDGSGQELLGLTFSVELVEHKTSLVDIFSDFDEWGLLFDVPRRSNERNQPYKNRIISKASTTRGSTPDKVAEALSIDLSLGSNKEKFSALVRTEDTGLPSATGVTFSFIDNNLLVSCTQFSNTSEVLIVDPITLMVDLSSYLDQSYPIVVVDENGNQIDSNLISVDYRNKKLLLKDETMARKDIMVTYKPYESISLVDITVGEVMSFLANLSANGSYILDIDRLGGSALNDEPAITLVQHSAKVEVFKDNELPDDIDYLGGAYIFYINPVIVKSLSSNINLYVNDRGGMYKAQLEGWYSKITESDGSIWRRTVLDRDMWQDENVEPHFGYIPNLTDPLTGSWSRLGKVESMTQSDILTLDEPTSTLMRRGLKSSDFRSGVGTSGDLYSTLVDIEAMTMQDYFRENDLYLAQGIIKKGIETNIPGV